MYNIQGVFEYIKVKTTEAPVQIIDYDSIFTTIRNGVVILGHDVIPSTAGIGIGAIIPCICTARFIKLLPHNALCIGYP